MPAYKTLSFVILLALISTTSPLTTLAVEQNASHIAFAPPISSGLGAALQWLSRSQSTDGSYSEYFPPDTAAAAYALWLNNTHSLKASTAYSWLAGQLNNSTNLFWGPYGEADIPGASLYSLDASSNLGLIHLTTVVSNLTQLQESNGGFFGFYSNSLGTVTSSVDTSEALRGLINSGAINASSQQKALTYLFALQNYDGSFNLTKSQSYANLFSQGPEPVSITALTLLALKDASYASSDSRVSKALSFLNTAATEGFTVLANDTSPVYSASLGALAFNAYGRTAQALTAVAFLLSHQDPDGGFRDSTRGSTGSNALDTAWASIALQEVRPAPLFAGLLRPVVLTLIVVGIVVLAVIASVVIFLVLRNRRPISGKSI